jgi:7-cyano-7-deazaguanine reductase
MSLDLSLLGKEVKYPDQYNPQILFSIARSIKRAEIGIYDKLPFKGVDIWNAYEISWLNNKGKPEVALGRFYFDTASEFIIESKSLKLYLNSFNNTKFLSKKQVADLIKEDLSKAANSDVRVELLDVEDRYFFTESNGICLDALDIEVSLPQDVETKYLVRENQNYAEEKIYSHLFKSNCLVTGQPDWATIFIEYKGPKMDHANLLKYLISYRNHNGFHEQCVERIYVDLMIVFSHQYLSVYAKYMRRGGLDICPYRATEMIASPEISRMSRQ